MQERRTAAKFCNMIYNLPEVLRNLESEFATQVSQKAHFVSAQESGTVTGLKEQERIQAYRAGQKSQMIREVGKERG